ncbi:MAG: hypothetical protein A2075_08990 [Geobacteraceae bacterium GWC2_58_44]|nr:MAG: hypothetical protein A2075_08990 [Geobacteraceae bacterium GWC2_58_44]
MEFTNLKTFIEVAKTGNLTRTADNLRVTPSAVSRRIKIMEEQYGYLLLDRSGPLLVPTEAGKLVFEKAQLLIQIEKELLCGLMNIRRTPKFSFGCTSAFGIAHLPEMLRGFMLVNAELNNLEFYFDMPDNLLQGLKDHTFDLAVIEHCEGLDLYGFTTFQLPEDEMIFVFSPLLLAGTKEITIDTLISQHLFIRKEGCCSSKLLGANMERIGRAVSEFSKVTVYDDMHIIIESAVKGHGIAYLSRSLVCDKIADGVLAAHSVRGFVQAKRRTLVLGDTARQEDATVKFAREILGYFGVPCELLTQPDVAV